MTGNEITLLGILKAGFFRGLKTGADLLKIMIPIFVAVSLLRHTAVVPFLQEQLASVMGLFSLPGEAAVPIVTGFFADEYGVVAAAAGFDFSAAAITTIAMITLCLHSIPLEAAVGKKIGFRPINFMIFRFVLAILTGLLVGQLAAVLPLGGGMTSAASDGMLATAESAGSAIFVGAGTAVSGWQAVALEILFGSLEVVLSLARIIIPLMIGIEFLLAYNVVSRIAPRMRWFCRILGVSDDALLPILIGLLMGVTYGAGTLMEINRRSPISERDLRLIGIFLYACHGIIETTVLFAACGANAFFVSVLRLLIAVLVTVIFSRLPGGLSLSHKKSSFMR